jgi:tetratricopeptide (TPR) repeat protein
LSKVDEAEDYFIRTISFSPSSDSVYSEILRIYRSVGLQQECILLFLKSIKLFPDKSSLSFCLGDLYRECEDFTKALLHYYKVLELTKTAADEKALEDSKFFDRIAISKVDLRNQTINFLETSDKIEYISKGRKIFEYEYYLPKKMYLFPNQRRIFEFGKYMGSTVNEVLLQNPDYISWCILNIDHFCTSEEIIEILKNKNCISQSTVDINLVKIKLKEANQGEYFPDPDPEYDYDNFDPELQEQPNVKFEFDLNTAAEIYRKWYILGSKNKDAYFDHEQESDMLTYLTSELASYIDFISSFNDRKYFRIKLPFLAVDKKSLRQITIDLFFSDNHVDCINIPGCMALGSTNKDKIIGILRALIEASDFRIKSGMSLMNILIPLQNPETEHLRNMILMRAREIKSKELIELTISEGWNITNSYEHNLLLGKESSKSVFTIPKTDVIPAVNNGYFELLRMFGRKL